MNGAHQSNPSLAVAHPVMRGSAVVEFASRFNKEHAVAKRKISACVRGWDNLARPVRNLDPWRPVHRSM